MPRRKELVIEPELLPFIDKCPTLTDEEKQILDMVIREEPYPHEKLGISPSTFYRRLKKAYNKLKKCVSNEIPIEPKPKKQEQPQEEPKQEKKEKTSIRGRDPEKTAIQQSLKILAREVGEMSAEQMKEILRIGIIFYKTFKYIHEVLGIPWEILIKQLYDVYIEHRDEIEIPYLDLVEQELLNQIAKALEEIETEETQQ